MSQHGPRQRIKAATQRVEKEIQGLSGGGSRFASGLASEGYAGGYRDALNDVVLVLNGIQPKRRDYWLDW